MDASAEKLNDLKYRPDIDGLRAVAVLLVLLNHLGTRATGGYVGVDVFFVISGYLISSQILTQVQAGRFTIWGFYERRIRRIFPALLALLAVATLVGYLNLAPADLYSFSQSLLAALFSVSNFCFWHQSGYFDAPSLLKPLLHTWSLGVEEQFYIFFPLFLIIVKRWMPGRLKLAIWIITGLTFTAACVCLRYDTATAFYFSPLRAWELLLGTIVSQRYVPAIDGIVARNIASLAGIVLILEPALAYNSHTLFPGYSALAPCLGTAVTIAAGETGPSLVGSLLSIRPIVFIGLISYSLYLWHWPIIVFARLCPIVFPFPLNTQEFRLVELIASFVSASLCWRFVELPFRKGKLRMPRKSLFLITGVSTIVLASAGLGLVLRHGIPLGYPTEALSIPQYSEDEGTATWRKGVCFLTPNYTFSQFNRTTCMAPVPGRKQYLLLGDSHAAHLYSGLSTIFPELNIMQANASFCPPLITVPVDLFVEFVPNCRSTNSYIFGDFLLHEKIDGVILSARWEEPMLPELRKTADWIQQHGMKVIVIGPSIEYDLPVPPMIVRALRHHQALKADDYLSVSPEVLDGKMATFVRNQTKAEYISTFEDLCTQDGTRWKCPVFAQPNIPLIWDSQHLTAQGSIFFAREIRNRGQIP
jgi:peptidoglycan/LPS O-acetylase OafA/YrhL